MNISDIVMRPEIWLPLFVLTGPGIELVPSVRAFRTEQAKHPRFTDLPSVGKSGYWILLGWFGPLTSAIMTMLSISHGFKHESVRNFIVTIVLLPIVMCAMIIIDGMSNNRATKERKL